MKKICFLASIILAAIVIMAPIFANAMRSSTQTPDVKYISPRNDHEVNLTGKDSLTFEWHSLPKPGGGREAYRFELFKGSEDNYNRIYSVELKRDVRTIDIPADMFEDGAMYSWLVKQRDARTSAWSRAGDRWRFTVIKK
ncbi:MAG: hypothetical protein KKD29_00080 [Candidatus Omnitrophica bacterium]|nr:hypothetical protein [Candidatus Omnitrophota bacterium]MBU4488947.1 hypothetical protein [Candidatus Omnitrophota bacterium]MCG2705243.1 hypothetical protein [Candidatus Omnitrophota bacterium]